MGFRCGLVGLPNAGKSTLFNALVGKGAEIAEYPFTTIDPNVGVVLLDDPDLDAVARISGSARVTPTALEVVDIAGLVKGAHVGEGLGNQFLGHVRSVDALFHVVRWFDAGHVPHTMGDVDPVRDAEIIDLELVLADLEVVERRLEKTAKMAKSIDAVRLEHGALQKICEALSAGKSARLVSLDASEQAVLSRLSLLTQKPAAYVLNVAEDGLSCLGDSQIYQRLRQYACSQGCALVSVSAKLESELAQLDPAEADEIAREMHIEERSRSRLVSTGHDLLGLITFITSNENETRAWSIRRGSRALDAAEKVHSQMARGFVRAEVVQAKDLINAGSLVAARQAGLTRIEGRDYVVKPADVILIRFTA